VRTRISHLVNSLTRQALYERVPGYVEKEQDFATLEDRLKREYGLPRVHRFDLGENADGCTPRVRGFVEGLARKDLDRYLSGYPESAGPLKERLSSIHGVPEEWIALGTGVVSFISNLCHAFYEWGDRVVLPTPSFFVIEEYILRSGALPIYFPASYDDGFEWTRRTTRQIAEQLRRSPIKMLWLCSPNNPTGRAIPADAVDELVRVAEETFTMVVADEAYGEFTDDMPEYASAVRLLQRHENLIVLRSFSKAYGLAGMRVGYAMMSSKIVHDAVARQMEYFPVAGLSLELARVAAEDGDYLAATRAATRTRIDDLQRRLAAIAGCECVPTLCNILLCRLSGLTTHGMLEGLRRRGVLVSSADIEGLHGQGWVRITCRSPEDNTYLLEAVASLAAGR
jgi:histidinol-phosphate aminotransferase